MHIEWIGTEGRGWNWGYRVEVRLHVFRFRLLSWSPFVRCAYRKTHWTDACTSEEEVEGVTFPSDAPWKALSPAAALWSAYDRRIREKHGLLLP